MRVPRRIQKSPSLRALERGAGPTHQIPNPADPKLLPEFRLYAVIKTWMDEDIIEATVRNAMIQGAEKVFIVDNGSTDRTVNMAEGAGATIAEVYETDTFDGRIAQALINAVVARESLRCRAPYVWWIHLDSDEFVEGPDGMTVRDYLATLDEQFKVVGSLCINHLPTSKPEYVSGFHPIDFQPLGYHFHNARSICGMPHWKHPLQRFDRHDRFLRCREGAHFVFGGGQLAEPTVEIITHHFQYRDEVLTRSKAAIRYRDRVDGSRNDQNFRTRFETLDAVYGGRWTEMEPAIPIPKPWPSVDRILRWYYVDEVITAKAKNRT
jgi:hypothetical protein